MNSSPVIWEKAIILVDMNAFFASVEQLDYPHLQGKPIAVTNGEQGSCIITSSYEARQYGIKTGMRLKQAKQLCPHLIQRPSRPKRYATISQQIMLALEANISPDIEIYSVDEAFLDVTHCQRLLGTPARIGKLAKKVVLNASGLLCSIGVSRCKTSAKFAANLNKPDGLTIIPPWEIKQRLSSIPVTDIWGINKGIGRFLAQYGAYTCGDVAQLPMSILAQRFGNVGRRIWYQCQGLDPSDVDSTVKPPKSMGHGKVMPPNTKDKETIITYLLHMSEKLAKRLRQNHLYAQHYFVGLKTQQGWLGTKSKLLYPCNDAKVIFSLCKDLLHHDWQGQGVYQVQITALDPNANPIQQDLFSGTPDISTREQYHEAMDAVNNRYGEFTLAPARLLNRSSMPNVIAPSWKPKGHRQSI